ncbi:hypothetical protein ACIG3E_11310 [Streptomyces sp. NPDC053474]|uniref:hypothetical protein n=1 Tax=Streptomyces sp. NPDC053474 TaxID=3365704 RepID=UPI0037CD7519
MAMSQQDLIDYFTRPSQRPLKMDDLKFAVIVHPWKEKRGNKSKDSKEAMGGLGFGNIIVVDLCAEKFLFVRLDSSILQRSGSPVETIPSSRLGLKNLMPDVSHDALAEALPADFDHERDCVAWFDTLAEAEACSAALRQLLN